MDDETFDRVAYWRHVVETDGPRAAAWLVWTHRRLLKRDGLIDFSLQPGDLMPNWMRAGLDCLKARRGWSVVEAMDETSTAVPETIRAQPVRHWMIYRAGWNSSSKLVGPRAARN